MEIFLGATDGKGKGKREEAVGAGTFDHPGKKNKRKQRSSGDTLVAAAYQKGGKVPAPETPDHFEKMWNGPCPNHTFPAKHVFRNCLLLKKFMGLAGARVPTGKAPEPPRGEEEKGNCGDDGFPQTDG